MTAGKLRELLKGVPDDTTVTFRKEPTIFVMVEDFRLVSNSAYWQKTIRGVSETVREPLIVLLTD